MSCIASGLLWPSVCPYAHIHEWVGEREKVAERERESGEKKRELGRERVRKGGSGRGRGVRDAGRERERWRMIQRVWKVVRKRERDREVISKE